MLSLEQDRVFANVSTLGFARSSILLINGMDLPNQTLSIFANLSCRKMFKDMA